MELVQLVVIMDGKDVQQIHNVAQVIVVLSKTVLQLDLVTVMVLVVFASTTLIVKVEFVKMEYVLQDVLLMVQYVMIVDNVVTDIHA